MDGQLKSIRAYDPAAALIYEEDEEAWETQEPSPTTMFCLLLVREFYRVELEFWHKWSPMSDDARYILYLKSMYEDRVCRVIMTAMNWPQRAYALDRLKNGYLQEVRENKKQSLLSRIKIVAGSVFFYCFLIILAGWYSLFGKKE